MAHADTISVDSETLLNAPEKKLRPGALSIAAEDILAAAGKTFLSGQDLFGSNDIEVQNIEPAAGEEQQAALPSHDDFFGPAENQMRQTFGPPEDKQVKEAATPAPAEKKPPVTPKPAAVKAQTEKPNIVRPQYKEENTFFAENFGKRPLMSLQDAIMLGISQNPDLQIAMERENQARFYTKEGQAAYYPRVEFTAKGEQQYNNPAGGYAERKGASNFSGEKALTLNQILFDGFSTIEEVKRRSQLEKSSEIRTRIEKERVLLDIIKFYLQIDQYQKTVAHAQNFINEMQQITDKIQIMQEAGGASMAQLDFARSRLSFATTELNTAISSLNDAVSNLEFLTGTLPEFSTALPEDLALDVKDIDFYLDMAKSINSTILLNRSEQDALRHRLNAEIGAYYPKFNFNLDARQSIDDGGQTKVKSEGKATIQMNFLLSDGNERASIINRVKSQINELDVTDRKNIIEIEKNVKLPYNQLAAKRDTLKSIDEEIQSNQTLRQLNRQNLELGNINIMEMIEVEERLYSARSRRQQTLADLRTSEYNLLKESGLLSNDSMLINDSLSSPSSIQPSVKPVEREPISEITETSLGNMDHFVK